MSQEHTPWTAEWTEESSDWVVMGCVYMPDAEGIAWQPSICTLSDSVRGDVARLIDAAPEMFDALQAFVRGCDHLSTPELELARSAIRKATESGQ